MVEPKLDLHPCVLEQLEEFWDARNKVALVNQSEALLVIGMLSETVGKGAIPNSWLAECEHVSLADEIQPPHSEVEGHYRG